MDDANRLPVGAVARWMTFGLVCGGVIGFFASLFAMAVLKVTAFRAEHPWMIFLLPAGGLLITFLYRHAGEKVHDGTDLVIESIRQREPMPPQMAPLIFVSTVITHLVGGSSGREGAALQMGGSLGSTLGRILQKPFGFQEKDHGRIVMCGMSAAFSAVFGTPIAAVVFALELSTVGIMHYSALLPCVLSSLTAFLVSRALGLRPQTLSLASFPTLNAANGIRVLVLSILCALVSILFCETIRHSDRFCRRFLKNDYVRMLASTALLMVLTLAVGSQTYNGAGAGIIREAVLNPEFHTTWYAFLLKLLFTAVTIAGGYRGGEIVPSFFIGAVFGSFYGPLLGLDPTFSATIGMGCMFCGITNSPLASLLICMEMFGFGGRYFFLLAIAATYLFSGNFGIYRSQHIRKKKSGLEATDDL